MEGSPTPYLIISNGEGTNGGMREPGSDGEPPHWLAYFAVDDIDGALSTVGRLGGTTLFGPQDIGIAKIAAVADPQGAVFALYSGQLGRSPAPRPHRGRSRAWRRLGLSCSGQVSRDV